MLSSQEKRDAELVADERRARLEAFAAPAVDEKIAVSPTGEQPDEPVAHWVHERDSLRNLHGEIDSSVSSLADTVASLQAKLAVASVEQNQTRRSFEDTKQQEMTMVVIFAPASHFAFICISCGHKLKYPMYVHRTRGGLRLMS